jgi:maleylacetoacetate isomerase/maleylpyruvate isomerase
VVHEGGLSDDTKNLWHHHWVRQGLEAERELALLATERAPGLAPSTLCWGDSLTWQTAAWCRRSSMPSALACPWTA